MKMRVRTEDAVIRRKPAPAQPDAAPKPVQEAHRAKLTNILPLTEAQKNEVKTVTLPYQVPAETETTQLLEVKESKLNYAILAALAIDVCVHIVEWFF